jgi:hypothetical protein
MHLVFVVVTARTALFVLEVPDPMYSQCCV